MHATERGSGPWGATALVLLLTACSSGESQGAGGASAGQANGTGAGSAGTTVGIVGTTGGIIFSDAAIAPGDGSFVVSDASYDDAACAAESHQGTLLPLDMYIMLDSSGSMSATLSDNVTTKWSAVVSALTSFVRDRGSAGLGVGLQYFPLLRSGVAATCDPTTQAADCGQYGPCDILNACSNKANVVQCTTSADCGAGSQCQRLGVCNVSPSVCLPVGGACTTMRSDQCLAISGNCHGRDLCDAASYATPAIEVAALPGAAANLVASLNAHMPDGLTPTAGALSGALSHAAALAAASPSHRVVVVLATDGLPSECTPTDIAGIATLASNAAAATPPISTFVVGVFTPDEQATAQSNLDTLAKAGGTSSAFVINTGQNVTTEFLNALNAIRTTALACTYAIPMPTMGQLDFGKINVRFTSSAGQVTSLDYVGSATGCTATGGWYYNVVPGAGTPTKILFCDATCSSFKGDAAGKVDILLGCQTRIAVH